MQADAGGDPDDRDAGAARLARSTLANLDAVTDRLVEEIVTENPKYYYAEQVSRSDLWASCRDNVERVLQLLGHCPPNGEDPYDAAIRTGRRRAEQRAPLDLVLRSFRLGGRVVWSSALDVARADGHIEQDLLLQVATSVWTVVDDVSSVVSDTYRRAELELLRADEQRRRVLIDGLLHGTGDDPASAESAMRTLGLPVTGSYVVVAGADEHGPLDLIQQEEALSQHGLRSVWQTQSGALVGIVALHERPAEVVTEIFAASTSGRVGVSPAVTRSADLPHGRELAQIALRTIPPGSTETVSLDDRLPQALVVRSPGLADRLVRRALGPVLELPDCDRDVLLDTLATWLDANRSAKLAAGRLFCHRNTVLNRLARIETLLGRSIHGVDDAIWLGLALYARRMRGS